MRFMASDYPSRAHAHVPGTISEISAVNDTAAAPLRLLVAMLWTRSLFISTMGA